jgi:glycosyltransferase involved in cell wall biosynthesis
MVSLDMMRALLHHINEYDILHIQSFYRFPSTIAAFLARSFKVPYIMQPHGCLDPFLFYKSKNRIVKRVHEYLAEKPNLNNATAVQYTSKEEKLLVPLKIRAKSLIIPLGLDLKEYENWRPFGTFRKKYNLEGKKIILHFGRINFKKGLDILVKAFARVASAREDICLVLAGPDNEGYSRQVDRWLVQEGVRDKAIFTGMLQGGDKLAVLKDADIFALPSYSENFGIAVVEAMACGLPVVISNKVNIWREIEEAKAGLVTTCNADEVAGALSILLDDENLRFRIIEAGKSLVSRKFNWDVVVNEVMKAYRDIIKQSGHKKFGT